MEESKILNISEVVEDENTFDEVLEANTTKAIVDEVVESEVDEIV